MIVSALAGISLVLLTASNPTMDLDRSALRLSPQQKTAAVQPLVRRATECVARKVVADPRAAARDRPGVLGDLIVASMPSCAELMRAMIEEFDRYFGEGTGESYFSGPYLDALPDAVNTITQELLR